MSNLNEGINLLDPTTLLWRSGRLSDYSIILDFSSSSFHRVRENKRLLIGTSLTDFAHANFSIERCFYKMLMTKCSIEQSSISETYIFLVLRNIKGTKMYTHLSLNLVFGKILQSRFKYRDRASIISDILDSINSDPRGKTKTSIMRGANLSLEQVNKYLQHLVVSGVIKTIDPLESQEIARYKLTTRGLMFTKDVAMWRSTLAPHRCRTV